MCVVYIKYYVFYYLFQKQFNAEFRLRHDVHFFTELNDLMNWANANGLELHPYVQARAMEIQHPTPSVPFLQVNTTKGVNLKRKHTMVGGGLGKTPIDQNRDTYADKVQSRRRWDDCIREAEGSEVSQGVGRIRREGHVRGAWSQSE